MRTFEVLLILVSLSALLSSFGKQSKIVQLATAGAGVFILLLHGIFEGFRYQMIFAYVFVILFAVLVIAKTKDRNIGARIPKTLRVIGICLSLVLLGFTSYLAYALPVFKLPKPAGSYEVGIQYFHLTDENRLDPFLDQSPRKRELMIKIYYPARRDNSKPFSPYFHSPQLVRSFTAFHGMPDFLFDQLNLVRTNSKEGLQLSDKEQAYPVILFSHGAGTSMETQTSQSEDLASHGYIVVAIDHTYVSVASAFPDRLVSSKEATTDFGPDPAEIITQIMADDSSFVIHQLEDMNEGKIETIFKGKLDLQKIGAIGHSVGGAVAYNLAINDPRVRAAIDLDGVVYVLARGGTGDMAPFLMLANDQYHIQAIINGRPLIKTFVEMDEIDQKITIDTYGSRQAYEKAYNKAQQNASSLTEVLKSSRNLFTIEGCDHMKFTDIGLYIGSQWLREQLNIGGKTGPARCLQITEAVSRVFFDQHLKNENGSSLDDLMKKFPDLRKANLQ